MTHVFRVHLYFCNVSIFTGYMDVPLDLLRKPAGVRSHIRFKKFVY